MADEISFYADTGLTASCQLYANGATVGSALPATEVSSSGVYFASIAGGTALGNYSVLASDSNGNPLGGGNIYWNGIEEINGKQIDRLHKAQGLQVSVPATNDLSNLVAGEINVDITGDLQTTTTYTATS